MKIGRLILTHDQSYIPLLKDFYLPKRTEFLVIGYNRNTADIRAFVQTDNFKLFPYSGKGEKGSAAGQTFLVWKDVAKNFPQIDAWVIHDYDVLCKPTDAEIFSHIGPDEFGVLGRPFASTAAARKGATNTDIFPFFWKYLPKLDSSPVYRYLEKELLKFCPVDLASTPSIMTGYGDFIATSAKNLLLLDDKRLEDLKYGGGEQVPHTVLCANHIKPVDLRPYFSMVISLDNTVYIPFNTSYQIAHPVKFWPGLYKPTFNQRLRRFLKNLIYYGSIARSRP